jgi:hypothetical protein
MPPVLTLQHLLQQMSGLETIASVLRNDGECLDIMLASVSAVR